MSSSFNKDSLELEIKQLQLAKEELVSYIDSMAFVNVCNLELYRDMKDNNLKYRIQNLICEISDNKNK